jgi:hypothetical protein
VTASEVAVATLGNIIIEAPAANRDAPLDTNVLLLMLLVALIAPLSWVFVVTSI